MAKGKNTCKILKEIRKQIAAENDIEFVTTECTYKGDCRGTCPKCEAEVRYLEQELEKRQRMGKAAMVAGLSVGLMASSQMAFAQQPEPPEKVTPEAEELMGMVKRYVSTVLYLEDTTHQDMLDLLVSPEMKNLKLKGCAVNVTRYASLGDDELRKHLKESAKRIEGPWFYRGENELWTLIALELDESVLEKASGDVEIAFRVDSKRHVSNVEILKGINEQLDGELVKFFESKVMGFEPGVWELESGEQILEWCDCVLTIHFPLEFSIPAPLEGEVIAPDPRITE